MTLSIFCHLLHQLHFPPPRFRNQKVCGLLTAYADNHQAATGMLQK